MPSWEECQGQTGNTGRWTVPTGSTVQSHAFEKSAEQKWKDALNMAPAKPAGWGSSIPDEEKPRCLPRRPLRPS
jgi:hypothetical protein